MEGGVSPEPCFVGSRSNGADLYPLLGSHEEIRDPGDVVRTQDQVQPRKTAQEGFSFLLCDTAAHRENKVGIPKLSFFQAAQQRIHFVFRLFPDRAGVENHEIGSGGDALRGVSLFHEAGAEPLGITDIHLAAEGVDKEIPHHQSL